MISATDAAAEARTAVASGGSKMGKRLRALSLSGALMMAATASAAVTIVGNFQVAVLGVSSPLRATFMPGDTMFGSFEFDSTAVDSVPANSLIGTYAASNLVIQLGTFFTNAAEGTVEIWDGFTGSDDAFFVGALATGPAIGSFVLQHWGLSLIDPTQAVFSADSLPASLALADFATSFFSLTFYDGMSEPVVQGYVTSISLTVPEPCMSLLALFALGLGLPCARRSA
jgi:hypothetical protein